MKHPILDNIWKTITYLFLLSVLTYFYFLLSSNLFDYSTYITLSDTAISFLIIGLMNLGLWFYIFYNQSEKQDVFRLVIQQLTVSVIYSLIWFLLSSLVFLFFIQNQDDYFSFLQNIFEVKFFIGLMIYFIMMFFYNLVIISRKNKINNEQRRELSTMLQQEELNSLKAQINPHFLFNSLNSISSLVYDNADDAHEAIVKLSDYFRYTLTLSKNQFTKVKEEIENVERYFEIEKIRFPEKMGINYKIDLSCNDFLIPVLILQPIAENAVKHGVYQNIEKSYIDISVRDDVDFYSIIFKNNFEDSTSKSISTSTGLENIRKRLRLIYDRNDLLSINKTEETFEIKIDIPKNI
ncbi:MAG: histidine kinase [Bacteroidetes bacterium]|nr:histidine kinase [Bacteroidota bacterium]